MLTFGSTPEPPSYRAPMAPRLMPLAPSAPIAYFAVTVIGSPDGVRTCAETPVSPSSNVTTRPPIRSRTVGSSAACARSTRSTIGCGTC